MLFEKCKYTIDDVYTNLRTSAILHDQIIFLYNMIVLCYINYFSIFLSKLVELSNQLTSQT